jgi:DNA primase
MQGINSEVIAEVRSRAGLVDVISEHVVLKKSGKDYKGLCPFHGEKTPSFYVNADKGIYKCFGCGEGGDVFSFVQKIKRLDFVETVKELAGKYGVPLIETQDDRQRYDRRVHILMLHQQAAKYFTQQLDDPTTGNFAREYLKNRGITDESIQKFGLGYAPAGWDGLLSYLMSAEMPTEDKAAEADSQPDSTNLKQVLAQAGLVRRKEETGSYYDLFRNRLMVPIRDDRGRAIAFGGRTLGEDDQVKYLNSPETPIYTKGEHLFAFDLAKESIRQRDAVIVVEGYFDAIAMHQFGFTNTVASLGTALTEKQAKQLIRYTDSKRVYLCFDADAAGSRAVERGVEVLRQIAFGLGVEMRVVCMPGGKDPDECLRTPGGVQNITEALEQAPLLIDYQLDRAVAGINATTHTGRIEASKALVPILAVINNSVERSEYMRKWALQLGIREEDLASDVGYYRRRQGLQSMQSSMQTFGQSSGQRTGQPQLKSQTGSGNTPRPGWLGAERQLLSLYLVSPESHSRLRASLANEQLVDPVHEQIKQTIEKIDLSSCAFDELPDRILDQLAPEPEVSKVFVEVLLKVDEIKHQGLPIEVLLQEAHARVLKEKLSREKDRLRAILGKTGQDEHDRQNELSSCIVRLSQLEAIDLPGALTAEDLTQIITSFEELVRSPA